LRSEGLTTNDLNVVMELGSPESVKGAVEAGVGVSIISRSTLMKELKLGSLKAISLEQKITRPFSHVRQRQKFRHRAIGELIEFAEKYCKERARTEGFEVPE
jgi:DNA-binding transcriptional LysR family regulator